jgi:hypothetical protein
MITRYRLTLINLFEQVHRVQTNPNNCLYECLDIQETLIKKITYIERNIRKRKAIIKQLKWKLGNKDDERLSKEIAQKAKDKVNLYQNQIKQYQSLILILKMIGDALAFSYINKWDIKPLAFKSPPGFISGKKGSRLERKILRKIFESGHVALLNDITNCLRYGDITVIKEGKFFIIEATSGKRDSKRKTKQLHDINNIMKYLQTDRTDNLYHMDGDFRRISLLSQEVNHVKKLNEIVHLALEEGQGYLQVEDGLHYIATTKFDPSVLTNINNTVQLATCIISATNTINAYYPIILSLNDPEAIYRFFLGELHIIVAVDTGLIEQQLDPYNLTTNFSIHDPFYFATITNPGLDENHQFIKISRVFWSRLYYEFLSLDWFLKEIVQQLKIGQLALNL